MTPGGPGRGRGPGDGWGAGDGWGPRTDDGPEEEATVHDAPQGASGVSDPGPHGAPPPRLAPMAVGTLFEVAGRIIRRHALPLLTVSAIFQLPSSLLDAAAQQHLGHALSPIVVGLGSDAPRLLEPTSDQTRTIVEALLLLAGTSVVGTLLGALATLAFTTAVLADYQGRIPTTGAMIGIALRRALPALAAGLLAALALLGVIVAAVILAVAAVTALPAPDGGAGGAGAFLAILVGVSAVVLASVVIVRLALPAAVLAAEPVGATQALRRSWSLTGGRTWRTFAVLASVAIAMTIVGSALLELVATVITDGLAAGMGLADLSDTLLAGLVSTLLAPIGGVVLAVLYLDLRVRHDGWQPQGVVSGG